MLLVTLLNVAHYLTISFRGPAPSLTTSAPARVTVMGPMEWVGWAVHEKGALNFVIFK